MELDQDPEHTVWGVCWKDNYGSGYRFWFEICHHIDDWWNIFRYFNGSEADDEQTERKLMRSKYYYFYGSENSGCIHADENRKHNQELVKDRIIPLFGKEPDWEPFYFSFPRQEFVGKCREWHRKKEEQEKKERLKYQQGLEKCENDMWERLQNSDNQVFSGETIAGCALPERRVFLKCHQDDFDLLSTIFDEVLIKGRHKTLPLMTVMFRIFSFRSTEEIKKLLGIKWGWPMTEEWKEFYISRQEFLNFAEKE
jgi:hypothetical protein